MDVQLMLPSEQTVYCQFCGVIPATLTVTFIEPIQLNLFNKEIVCMTICEKCYQDALVAEQYAVKGVFIDVRV